jgi:hypothetical protein
MKILMAMFLSMLVTTAVHAACKLGDTCTLDECKALDSKYGLNADKKCVNPLEAEEKGKALEDCSKLVGTGDPAAKKGSSDANSTSAGDSAKNTAR